MECQLLIASSFMPVDFEGKGSIFFTGDSINIVFTEHLPSAHKAKTLTYTVCHRRDDGVDRISVSTLSEAVNGLQTRRSYRMCKKTEYRGYFKEGSDIAIPITTKTLSIKSHPNALHLEVDALLWNQGYDPDLYQPMRDVWDIVAFGFSDNPIPQQYLAA